MQYTGEDDLKEIISHIKNNSICYTETKDNILDVLKRIHNEAYQDGYLKGVEINKEINKL